MVFFLFCVILCSYLVEVVLRIYKHGYEAEASQLHVPTSHWQVRAGDYRALQVTLKFWMPEFWMHQIPNIHTFWWIVFFSRTFGPSYPIISQKIGLHHFVIIFQTTCYQPIVVCSRLHSLIHNNNNNNNRNSGPYSSIHMYVTWQIKSFGKLLVWIDVVINPKELN